MYVLLALLPGGRQGVCVCVSVCDVHVCVSVCEDVYVCGV